jgi:4-diphosphocytidyl-2-C-methyl-D-erythritol kinase
MLFQRDSRTLTVWAPAKLNLFLEVLGKRPDGFHELETLMTTVGLYDTLTFSEEPARAVRLSCRFTDPADEGGLPPDPQQNLVVRAAQLLRQSAGINRGVHIELTKRIPLAAGLAGGSTDAAATLAGLNLFWNAGLSAADLQTLAAQLGSDIPFFLHSTSTAICRGRGERIEPLSLPNTFHFVIVRPASGLATALVFKNCRPAETPVRAAPLVAALRQGDSARCARLLHNRLQPPAESLNADVVRLRQEFEQLPVLGHLMSGSGTSYFGLCSSRRHASAVAARLRARRAGRVFVVQCRP